MSCHPLETSMKRRHFLFAGTTMGWIGMSAARAPAASIPIEVWKSPECGCCKAWITHLERHGFVATVHNNGNTDARKAMGMPVKFGSCHTAKVGAYVIEGHVPAREIHRLLSERPKAVGLAVPAMPLGSPGMDGPDYDNRTQPYDVMLVLGDGSGRVYQSYP
jgi:hypothetical protein